MNVDITRASAPSHSTRRSETSITTSLLSGKRRREERRRKPEIARITDEKSTTAVVGALTEDTPTPEEQVPNGLVIDEPVGAALLLVIDQTAVGIVIIAAVLPLETDQTAVATVLAAEAKRESLQAVEQDHIE